MASRRTDREPGADLQIGRELKRLRLQAGLSLRAFAAGCQFSPSFVSQVETDQVSPSIGSLARMTSALGVTLSDLFEAESAADVSVVRGDSRSGFRSAWSRARVDSLIPRTRASRLDAFLVTIEPGGRSARESEERGVDQFAMALRGPVVLSYGQERIRLRTGDSVLIRKRAAHAWSNPGRADIEILIVSLRR